MMIVILPSLYGIVKQLQTSQTSIAFLITAELFPLGPFSFRQLTKGTVHVVLWCQSQLNSLVL